MNDSVSPGEGELNMVETKGKVAIKGIQEQRVRENNLEVNEKYKDTVFRMLFSDRKNLLSLYNALNGTGYDNLEELEIVTLENAIYMGMKNDLAFILDFNLFLWEHQSTYNPNIPLRDLMYISSEYQKYVYTNKISLYSSKQQKIPAPQFLVFYNGERKIGECIEHRLSDAYDHFHGEPALELKVKVININEGYNRALMEQCQVLKEYAQYVAKVRNYRKSMSLNTAVEKAITECIQAGVLRDFLLENRGEVMAMSIFEYDKEVEEEWLRKAEYEAGREDGREVGKSIEQQLIKHLLADNRIADIKKVLENEEFRSQVLKEYGIEDNFDTFSEMKSY